MRIPSYCIGKILLAETVLMRRDKNIYAVGYDSVITVIASAMSIITAHHFEQA